MSQIVVVSPKVFVESLMHMRKRGLLAVFNIGNESTRVRVTHAPVSVTPAAGNHICMRGANAARRVDFENSRYSSTIGFSRKAQSAIYQKRAYCGTILILLYFFSSFLFLLFFFTKKRRYSKDEIRFVALVSITEASHIARFAFCSLYWHVGAIFEASASCQKFGIFLALYILSLSRFQSSL